MIRFSKLANELSALIDDVPFAGANWHEIVTVLSDAFPGSFAAAHNKNFSTLEMHSFETHNMEETFQRSYRDHFASVNPWIGYWSRVRSGVVAASEAVAPARLFSKSEFYNDWLRPQKSMEAAAGVKIEADKGESVQLLLHYPLKYAPEYDAVAVRLLERLKGSLDRTVKLAQAIRSQTETAASAAAFVGRNGRPAFVMGDGCRLIEANDAAEQLFRLGTAVSVIGGKVHLRQMRADAILAEAVSKLCRGEEPDISGVSFETAAGRWHFSLAAIGAGAAAAAFGSMFPPRRMVFVLATELSARHSHGLDLWTARQLFGLTTAEHALCVRLLFGDSLSEAADQLGVKKETVRTQLRMVFEKTGMRRQSELILLLAKFS